MLIETNKNKLISFQDISAFYIDCTHIEGSEKLEFVLICEMINENKIHALKGIYSSLKDIDKRLRDLLALYKYEKSLEERLRK